MPTIIEPINKAQVAILSPNDILQHKNHHEEKYSNLLS